MNRNNAGLWLLVCVAIAALVGYVLHRMGVVQ
jgi:hypothetical protein